MHLCYPWVLGLSKKQKMIRGQMAGPGKAFIYPAQGRQRKRKGPSVWLSQQRSGKVFKEGNAGKESCLSKQRWGETQKIGCTGVEDRTCFFMHCMSNQRVKSPPLGVIFSIIMGKSVGGRLALGSSLVPTWVGQVFASLPSRVPPLVSILLPHSGKICYS